MKWFVLVSLLALFGGCFNDGNCVITATNSMHIQFKKESNKTDSTITLDTVYISGTDTFLIVNSALTEILLPVDVHHNVTTFVLTHTNSDKTKYGSDTIQVGYTAQSKVIARDCGAFTYYQNLNVLHTSLKDSQLKSLSTSLLKDPTIGETPSAYAVNYQIFY